MSDQYTVEKPVPVMPTYNRFPVTLTKGLGSYVWDEQEKKYLDFTSGIATCNLGHRPPEVQKAISEQLDKLWHCSNLYHIPSQTALAEKLVAHSCGDQVFFCNSGAEANEAAIKIARRYAQKVKNNDKFEIVTFKQSFHGRTLATLSATGQEKIQEGFSPAMPGFRYLPYNDQAALEDLIAPETCAVMLELVQGEGGVIPADDAWVKELVRQCQEQEVLIIIDEIQTGMGRTGTLFAYEQYDFEPDIITIAKGLGSGFPIGAMIAKEDVAKAFAPGTHGSTFGGNPLATTAGLRTLELLMTPDALTKWNETSAYLWGKLEELAERSDKIKQVRGKGFLIGLEVDCPAIELVTEAREEHQLLILVAGPNVVRILPPLTTTKEEVDQALAILTNIF
ncbi:acetylornithine aminotransferase [Natronobacillus azotifigens]|uniref:Acetylornithine aminotransferase n=1 Tax=Natronobacillus azotifigens TaxID=472978 RepID=A0A9J6RAV9_9BACI|nr:acetylornithine transaminase [Natronobacillus azotifigens]MCZ0702452.1 acetylornithine transaminase [Natronobacillus azotifigens]